MHRNWPENHDKYLLVVTIQFRPKRSRSRFEWEDVTFVPSRSNFKCETSCLSSGWRELTSWTTNFVNVKYKTEKSLQPVFGYQTSINVTLKYESIRFDVTLGTGISHCLLWWNFALSGREKHYQRIWHWKDVHASHVQVWRNYCFDWLMKTISNYV